MNIDTPVFPKTEFLFPELDSGSFYYTILLMWKYVIIIFGFGLDQITKLWARTELVTGSQEIIPDFLQLYLTFNKGIAFSIPITRWFSSALSIAVIIYIFWLLKKSTEKEKIGYALVLAGAFGNLFDRLWFGEVTDFISVLQFPIFNVADMLVSMGVILIVWLELFGKRKAVTK